MPIEFERFAEACIALDNQLYARTLEKKTSSTRTPTSIPQGEPMELDSTARKAYRKANNLYTYYGNPNH